MSLIPHVEFIGQIRNSTRYVDTRLARVANNSMRWGVVTYVPPASYGTSEHAVRGAASVAMLEAVGIQTSLYDPDLAGFPNYQSAINRANLLLNATVGAHKLFTTGGWGGQWQSAWWGALLGTTGWVQWRYLAVADRERLLQVLEYEADQRLAQPPRYLRDAAGAVLTPGDTGAEENAWNAAGLVCAALMMPSHPRALNWMSWAVGLGVASFAHPDDVGSDQVINGRQLNEWLEGSNVEDTYDVINHGKVNPDYSQAVCLFGHVAILFGLAGKPMPSAFNWNADKVYARLARYYAPGEPTQPVLYPEGPDWGVRRSVSCWWPDVCAQLLGWDAGAARPAGYWADVHLADADIQQARYGLTASPSGDGHMYAPLNATTPSLSEDSYPAREQIACYQVAAGHLLTWLHTHGRLRTTSAAF